MGHGDQWDRAQRAAARRRRRAGRRRSRDPGAVLGGRRRSRCSRPTIARRLQSEITAATLSAGATRYGPALKLAGSLLAASNLPRREVVLVSDFQRSGWSPGDGLRLPAGTMLTPVAVPPDAARNLAVTPITVQRDQSSGQDRVTVTAGVMNRSDEAVTDVPVSLELDGHVAETARVTRAAQRLGVDDVPAGRL